MTSKRVADLTVEEFRAILQEELSWISPEIVLQASEFDPEKARQAIEDLERMAIPGGSPTTQEILHHLRVLGGRGIEQDRPVAVEVSAGMLRLSMQDGHHVALPLEWYPSLVKATPEQLTNVVLAGYCIQWPELGLDWSITDVLYKPDALGGGAS